MQLYLVQHGDAVDKETNPARPLSEAGRKDVERVAAFLAPKELTLDQIWHSGKARARETAAIFAERLQSAAPPGERPGLSPKDPVAPLRDLLGTYDGSIMLVGHLPHLAKLSALLLTGDEASACVRFSKGGVVALGQDEAGQWQVRWMVIPELLG